MRLQFPPRHGLDECFNTCFGKTREPHFAFTHEITSSALYILHRHGPIDPMLVEQIEVIDAEAAKRCVGDLSDMFGPTIDAGGHAS